MKSPRICLIQSNPVWGACEEYLTLLANGLIAKGLDITVVYPKSSSLQPMIELFQKGIQQVPLPAHTFSSLAHVGSLCQVLGDIQPDIVHCNDPGLVAMLAATLNGISHRVLTFHTPAQSFSYRLHAKLLQRWVLHQGWQFVVISGANQPILQHQYTIPEKKISVIEHGLEPKKFEIPDTIESIRAEFGIAPDCTLVGCVARLATQKNHALLLDAYAALPETLKARSHLLLVGDGELRSTLEQQVARLGLVEQVTFAGYRRDIPQLLQAMDIFVLSSNYEGLPFAVLEAMAMSLPIVATAVNGVRDAIIPGETGLLVPPGQVGALGDAIAQLISNPEQCQRMGQASRDRFLRHYTAERMVHQTEELYSKLIRKSA
ncbi:MAG: glycosyltransferase [Xenococcaceae cyanobacterium]